MILITGATGYFGNAIIDFLINNGIPLGRIAALVRNKKKGMDLLSKGITLRIADSNEYASLIEAFNSVDKVLLISGDDPGNRAKQHLNVINAAKEAGVKHILYTSFERKNEKGSSPVDLLLQSHIYTEKIIKECGIPYTIFRNNLPMDMLPMFLGEEVLATGVYFPAEDGEAAFTLGADVAETVANVLTNDGHENKEYCISNTENSSFQNIADVLCELSGEAVMYHSPDTESYLNTLVTAGVSKEDASFFASIGEAIKQGEFYSAKSDLESLLGRKPASLKVYLKKTFFSKSTVKWQGLTKSRLHRVI
jgi:NAD(P)H dehydrogenase (quinone)